MLPLIKNTPAYITSKTPRGFRPTERKCSVCNCIVDILLDDDIEIRQRKFLCFNLDSIYLCAVCSKKDGQND